MTTSGLVRIGGFANLAFGMLLAASACINLALGDPTLAAWPALLAVIAGLIGLAALRTDGLGRLALAALILGTTGLALSAGQFYALTFSPLRTGPLGPLFPLGYGPLLYGFLALAVLVLIRGGLPRGAAVLLLAGVALNAAGFAAPEVRLGGVVIFGAGMVWLGARTVRTPVMLSPRAPRTERLRIGI